METLNSVIGVVNANEVTVVVNTPEQETRKRKCHFKERKLPKELKARFKTYFLRKYPITKKIKIDLDPKCAYYARAVYKSDCRHTFKVRAYEYETLIIRMQEAYASRGIPAVNNR